MNVVKLWAAEGKRKSWGNGGGTDLARLTKVWGGEEPGGGGGNNTKNKNGIEDESGWLLERLRRPKGMAFGRAGSQD